MNPRISFLLSPVSSLAARLRRSRPGSVLIIVIVLLLLLAILGAAFISTTRSSRVASAQNVLSTDVDTALNGIAEVCQGVIADDLNDTFGDLHGNTAYVINPAPANSIINHSIYQGQAQTSGSAPAVAPNVVPVGGSPPTGYTYNPGDIISDPANPLNFYDLQSSNNSPLVQNTADAISKNPWPPVAPNTTGWQIMNGRLPVTANGSDPWLADRLPDPAGTNSPIWTAITQSVEYNATSGKLLPQSILNTDFEDPITGTDLTTTTGAWPTSGLVGAPGLPTPLTITALTATDPIHLANGLNQPAFQYGAAAKFTAADADGDGIADSLYFPVPGLSLDGLTWFAAARIIDNNSAINANTSWSRDQDYVYSAGAPTAINNIWNLFQTSVGLQELINTSDPIGTLNQYRFNSTAVTANPDPLDESAIDGNTPPAAFDRKTTGGKDYSFISEGEAFYQQFIRRIANPGYNTYSGAPPVGSRYQALPLSDEAALAYHFCLQNPNAFSQSVTESLLPNSLCGTSSNPVPPTTPYDPASFGTWFNNNFAYPAGSDNLKLPMRALLVTRNPVSNYIQHVYNNNPNNPTGAYFSSDPLLPNYMLPYGANTASGATNAHYRGVWNTGTPYAVNDMVLWPGPTASYAGPNYTFVAIAANTGVTPGAMNSNYVITPPTSTQLANWRLQPWSTNAVKANVNTAAFPELFRAFWSVMASNPSYATPFGVTGVDGYAIYDPTPTNPQFIFRSPLRDPTGYGTANVSLLDAPSAGGTVTNTNVMLLRAALAAVNTLGLRDNSQNVTSRTIVLQNPSQIDSGATPPPQAQVELQVYSSAPQPVISEVYVNTYTGPDPANGALSNPQGYVAVELYNPYPVTMILKNWQLGLINRTAAGSPAFPKVYPYLGFQTFPAGAYSNALSVSVIGPMVANNDPTQTGQVQPPAGTVIIPAHGYALLENYNALGITPQPGDALVRPASAVHTVSGTTPGSFATTQPSVGTVSTGVWYGPNGIGAGTVLPNTCDIYVPNLQLVIAGTTASTITGTSTGGELVLLRPRQANGFYTSSTDPQNTFNEGTYLNPNLYDLVPVDSYDFSGLSIGSTSAGTAWSYIRMKGSAATTWFKQFFPGFYSVTNVVTAPREAAAPLPGGGTDSESVASGTTNGWITINTTPCFGFDATSGSYANNFPPVQLYNTASGNAAGDMMHFPNSVVSSLNSYPNGIPLAAGQTYLHPLGGFARNGDMLDIPCIGAYRIRIDGGPLDQVQNQGAAPTAPPYFLELNSLPKDCSLAAVATGNATVDATFCLAQNVGRFVPMSATYPYVAAIQGNTAPAGMTFPLPDYYSWTRNLFNYLTVQSSTDTYLPNFDPNLVLGSPTASGNPAVPYFAYPPQNVASPGNPTPPTPALTANATATDQTAQDNVGVEGLININTASWKVLSMLPFVPSNVAGYVGINQQIAKNIVTYRLQHGPFTSIFDLNQVPGFQNGSGLAAIVAPTAPASATGLLSPADPNFESTAAASTTPTGISEDYQWDCLTLDRISNLITTRSDTFTIYVVLQGWQNVGTANAQPMVTRRFAYIVDRSAVNADPTARFLKTLTVPND
ncbi:MAG: helix-hairpin-helix domain-containing protein [Tepidisphaeraceae bacterium]